MERPTVYVGMVGDLIHAGHINILAQARALGRVVVGVLTDDAVASYKRKPLLELADRMRVIENVVGVDAVMPQRTLSYRDNLLSLRPRYVVHGDDWRVGPKMSRTRQEVIDVLAAWGGELIEPPYTSGVSSTLLQRGLEEQEAGVRTRQGRLQEAFRRKPFVRIIEAHNALAALVASRAERGGRSFDALWQSSFTDAAVRGKADLEIVDVGARLTTINEIFDSTTLPLIYDGDTGGFPERVENAARLLDRAGVSALCLEDKNAPKRNSLLVGRAPQQQSTIHEFCARIAAAKRAAPSMAFVARVESFVLGAGLADALERSSAYVEAGADMVIVHSVLHDESEVTSFARSFRSAGFQQPLIVIPTTFGSVSEDALCDAGISGVIYANHLLRAAYPQMEKCAAHILQYGRSDDEAMRAMLAPISDIFSLIPSHG
ncbi:MAG: isocitrate lyase/phosphoenolpyruvate mutase family protein [Vitreimonas sp.]